MNIHLEHVRSFKQGRSVPIRPLTLLVGQNSSGKSTFLAVVNAILDSGRFPLNPGFNEAPFNLGTFDTIATYRGGKYGRDDTFSVGFSIESDKERLKREVIATYNNVHGNPALSELRVIGSGRSLNMKRNGEYFESETTSAPNGRRHKRIQLKIPARMLSHARGEFPFTPFQLAEESPEAYETSWRLIDKQAFYALESLFAARAPYSGTLPVAPIRSKPKRTYAEIE
ncbi:MAG: AAA family ATPase, partial [Tepidisphaeraceae bacterium]